jgi:hypothetical protein
MESTLERMTRAAVGINTTPTAMMTFVALCPSAVTMAKARINGGNARSKSITRWIIVSVRPPTKPLTSPRNAPVVVPMLTAKMPTYSEIREP